MMISFVFLKTIYLNLVLVFYINTTHKFSLKYLLSEFPLPNLLQNSIYRRFRNKTDAKIHI